MSKKYNIDSLEKLINIGNKQNAQNLLIDFSQWYLCVIDMAEAIRQRHPEEAKKLTNYELLKPSFVWIDDKKHEMKGVKIINENTGEETKITIKK